MGALRCTPREELDSFWIALAIIYNNASGTFPIRQWYYQQFPDAVEGAVTYLAAVFATSAEKAAKENGTEFEDELIARLNKHLDPAVHRSVRTKIAERSWIVLSS